MLKRNFKMTVYPRKRTKCWSRVQKTLRFWYDFLIDVMKNSSVHGLWHITQTRRHPVEILVWICVCFASVWGFVIVATLILNRHLKSPTVVSMEADYLSWNITFPTITICPHSKIYEPGLEEYLRASNASNKRELEVFLRQLANTSYSNLLDLPKYKDLPSSEYLKILAQISHRMSQNVTTSREGHEMTLQKTVTAMGICFSFNSFVSQYLSIEYMSGERTLSEKSAPFSWDDLYSVHAIDGEVYAEITDMDSGFDIYSHSSTELPNVMKIATCKSLDYCTYSFEAYPIITTEQFKSLTIGQRKCRYPHEQLYARFPVYSYGICRLNSYAELSLQLCGCVPFFVNTIKGEKICDVKGMHCMGRFFQIIVNLQEQAVHMCVQNCEDTHFIKYSHQYINWFKGTNLRWQLLRIPKKRFKRGVIFSMVDVMVHWGGAAGLFIGCSVISFWEFLYNFTLKLYWFKYRYGKKVTTTMKQIKTKKR